MGFDLVLDRLQQMVEQLGSQKAVADKLGIGPAYLSDVLNGRRDPGPAILDALGFKAETVIVKKEPAA